jgi:CubicO group peptidase (beta-lactamase class C family)
VDRQRRRQILGPLGLRQTAMHFDAHIPAPGVHAYLQPGGRYTDTFTWSPTWGTYTGNMTSTLGDLGRWTRALGTGALLTPASREQQVGMQAVGLGPLTPEGYYGMGLSEGLDRRQPAAHGLQQRGQLPAREADRDRRLRHPGTEGQPAVGLRVRHVRPHRGDARARQAPNLPVCPRTPC